MKRLLVASIVVGAALACDQPVQPPLRGTMVIAFGAQRVQPSPTPAPAAAQTHGQRTPDQMGDSLPPTSPPQASGQESGGPDLGVMSQLTSARVQLSGPSPHDTTLTLSASGTTQLRLDSLLVGTYVVKVWGLVGDTVDSYGQADGVLINGGQSTTLDLTNSNNTFPWAPLRPTLRPLTSPTTAFSQLVHWSTVKTATGYQVQWSKATDFSGAQSVSVTDTIATFTAADTGRYHLRVKATVPATSNPRWSDTVGVQIAAAAPGGGDVGSPYSVRSGVSAVDTTLTGLNLVQAQVEDWFSLDACREDTLLLETRAARLTPPSPLNTLLRLYRPDGTTLVKANDDLSGSTTDSRIDTVLTVDGTFKIQVTEANNTVGNYELRINLRPGAQNTGTGCVPPGPATVQVTPDTVQFAALGDSVILSAVAKDAINRPLTGITFTWATRNAGVASVDAAGKVKAVGNGSTWVLGSTSGLSDSTWVVVSQAVSLSQSTVTVTPASVAAGSFATFKLVAKDSRGNRMPGGQTVVFSLSGGTSTGTMGSVVDSTTGTYTASFRGETVGTADTVHATIDGSAVSSALPTITVTPGPARKLAYQVQPAGATAGQTIAPTIEVIAQDSFNNKVPTVSGAVVMSVGTNPSGGTLFGTVTKSFVTGVASFPDLWIDRAGTGYTLKAKGSGGAAGLDSTFSATFNITEGAAKKLAFVVEPTNAGANANIAPAIQVAIQDSLGNTVTGATNAIKLSLLVNPGGSTLAGDSIENAAGGTGIATFSSIHLDKIATGYKLLAQSTGLTPDTSVAFNITAGAAARLGFTQEPSNVTAGVNVAPSIQVTVYDATGNPTTSSDTVALAILNNPGGATLSGTLKLSLATGVATFSTVSLNKMGVGYTLRATSGSLTPDTSAAFNVSASSPYQLTFGVQPSVTSSGASITPNPTVRILDLYGNPDTTATNTVNITIGTNPWSGNLTGTVSRAAVKGVATFNDLKIDAAGAGYRLAAAAGGLQGATSDTFSVIASTTPSKSASSALASPPAGVRVSGSPVPNGADSTDFRSIITVVVRDSSSNPIPGQTVAILASGSGNTITQPASNTDGSGVATGVIRSRTAETKTLTLVVKPGQPDSVVLDQQPTVQFVADTSGVSSSASTAAASPDTVIADGVQQSAITVTVQDTLGNLVGGRAVQLGSTGSGVLTQPGPTNGSGVTTGAIKRSTVGSDTIRVKVNPGQADSVVLTQRPVVTFIGDTIGLDVDSSTVAVTYTGSTGGDTAIADSSDFASITVTVRDTAGAPIAGDSVWFSFSGSGNYWQNPAGLTLGDGIKSTAVRSTVAEIKTVTVMVRHGTNIRELAAHPAIRFKAGSPAGLAFATQPATVAAGSAVSPSVQVAVVDAHGNTVTDDTRQVKVRFASNPGAATLNGDSAASAVSGVATFSNLSILTAASGYTLRAVDASAMIDSVVSNPFDVTAAAATQLAFQVQPTDDTAGVSLAPAVQVKVMDQYGNTATAATNAITVAFAARPDTSAVLSGTKSKNAVAGVATFTNLSINKAGVGYKLGATASGLDGDTSTAFTVVAAPAAKLKFTTQPANGTAGAALAAVQVTVQDAFGNTVTSDAGNVTVAIADDPSGGAATLSGTIPVAAVSGVAVFNDLSINKSGVNYSLVATRSGLTSDYSLHFNIVAAAANHLVFSVQPTAATAGVAISPAVRVAAKDQFENTATSFTDSVTVALADTATFGAALSGTKKVAAVSGVATFSTLSVDKVGTGYTLAAASGGLTPDTSATFNITVAGAAKVAFIQEPSAAAAGGYINPAVTVAIQDQFGNTLSSATNAVTVSILNNPAGGSLLGASTKAAVSGVATFDSITVDKIATGYTLLAQATSLASDTSAAFNVTAGAPSAVTSGVRANPATVIADGSQASTITVVVRDSFANPVTGQTVTLGATGSNNSITNPVSPTDGAGATTGTIASTTAEAKTVTATVGGSLALDSSATVVFVADTTNVSASVSTVTASAGPYVANGTDTSTITVTVKDPGGNPIAGKAVSIAVTGNNNTVTQPAGPTNGSGVAVGAVASTTAQTDTVKITVDGKLFDQKPTVQFVAGPPAQLGFVVQPSTVAAGSAIGPSVQVAVQDVNGNTVDTATTSVTLALGGGTPSSNLYGTLPVSAVAGIATFTDLKVDSVGTGYQLHATGGGYTDGVSSAFQVVPGAVYSIAVSASPDTLYVLGSTTQATAVARDSVGNVVPSAVFSWSSGDGTVMTVNPSTGLVTAVGRGLVDISATADTKTGVANLAVGVRLAGIGNAFGPAPGQLFSAPSPLPGVFTQLSPSAFNAYATAADLRAAYDVLLFGYNSDASVNAAWSGRLRDFLQLGGGIIFEDPANVAELSPVLTGTAQDTSGGIVLLPVSNFTGSVSSNFAGSHIRFSAWTDSLAHFLVQGDTALGLYGRFGNGCMVVTGTAQGTDGDRNGTATQLNQYRLLFNSTLLTADCRLNQTPGPAVSVRMLPKGHAFTGAGQSFTLRASALDSLGTPIPNHTFAWSSANDTVATVNPSTGEVTSARSGQVAIRAEGSGQDYALMTVGVPPSGNLNAWGTEAGAGLLYTSYFAASWGTSTSNYYVGGDGGQIRHFNGVAWDTVNSGTPNWLWNAWGSSANDVYFVGGPGTIVHYNGSSWGLIPIGGSEGSQYYYGVWGSGPSDVFVVGTGGVILHYDGNSWQPMPNPAAGVTDLYGVWGTSERNVWAVGYNVILHYDGATWTTFSNPLSGQQLFRVWGSSASDVFIVGIGGGDFAHFDGTSWSVQTNPAPGIPFYGLWGSSSTEVYAAGYQSIVKYNGSTWSKMNTPTPNYVLTIWGTADGQFRAAGAGGQVWHGVRGAVPATASVLPGGANLNGLGATQTFTGQAVSATGDLITGTSFSWSSLNTRVATIDPGTGVATVAGDGQAVVQADAGGGVLGYGVLSAGNPAAVPVNLWDSTASPGGSAWLWSVWGTSGSNIYGVGAGGNVYHYDGGSWSSVYSSGASQLRGIWGSSDNDIWVVGSGTILHYNGSWSTVSSPTSTLLYGVWGSAPNDVWAVGNSGTFIHYDGSNWSVVSVPAAAGTDFWAGIWGSARDTIFAGGSSGNIFRYDGSSWTLNYTVPGNPYLYRVWGTSGQNVRVVGAASGGQGTIYRFNGSSWGQETSNTTQGLIGIWGTNPSDVYAVGFSGTMLRFNGSVWSPQISRTTSELYGIWGTDTGNVWAVGYAPGGFSIRRGVRGGSLTAAPVISFAATNLYTKMNIASNGSSYYYVNGGVASAGKVYEYTLGGSFVDSNAVTLIDQRSILYRPSYGFYLKSYGSNWYTLDPNTGVTVLQFSSGFANAQSVPAMSLNGAFEIWEFTSNTIRRLNSAGTLFNTVTGVSGTSNAIATDGYYVYTQAGNTIYVYSANAITASNTAQLVGTFTVPNGTSIYSLSYANGLLFTSDGTSYYGYRVGVTP